VVYRKILNYLISIANWNGIATIYVDPKILQRNAQNAIMNLKNTMDFII
jgi:hypothetical protein